MKGRMRRGLGNRRSILAELRSLSGSFTIATRRNQGGLHPEIQHPQTNPARNPKTHQEERQRERTKEGRERGEEGEGTQRFPFFSCDRLRASSASSRSRTTEGELASRNRVRSVSAYDQQIPEREERDGRHQRGGSGTKGGKSGYSFTHKGDIRIILGQGTRSMTTTIALCRPTTAKDQAVLLVVPTFATWRRGRIPESLESTKTLAGGGRT